MRIQTYCLLQDKGKISQFRLCNIIPTVCGINGTNIPQTPVRPDSPEKPYTPLLKRDRMRTYSSLIKRPIKVRSTTEARQTSPTKYLSLRISTKKWGVYANADKLLGCNEDEKIEAQEFTKLMAIFTILQFADLKERVEVPMFVESMPNASAELNAYTSLTVEELLHAIILKGGSDGIWTLVVQLLNSHFNITSRVTAKQRFLGLMNKYAEQLGMVNTRFTNFDGQDDPNNVTSVNDMGLLLQKLVQYEIILEIIQKTKFNCQSMNGLGKLATQYLWRGNTLVKHGFRSLMHESGCYYYEGKVIILIKSRQVLNDLKMIVKNL